MNRIRVLQQILSITVEQVYCRGDKSEEG